MLLVCKKVIKRTALEFCNSIFQNEGKEYNRMGVNRCNAHQGADGLNGGVKVDHALVNAHLVAVEGVGSLRKHTSVKQQNTRLVESRAKVEKEKNRRLFDTRHGQKTSAAKLTRAMVVKIIRKPRTFPQGDFLTVNFRCLVGMRTGPLMGSDCFLPAAIKEADAAEMR